MPNSTATLRYTFLNVFLQLYILGSLGMFQRWYWLQSAPGCLRGHGWLYPGQILGHWRGRSRPLCCFHSWRYKFSQESHCHIEVGRLRLSGTYSFYLFLSISSVSDKTGRRGEIPNEYHGLLSRRRQQTTPMVQISREMRADENAVGWCSMWKRCQRYYRLVFEEIFKRFELQAEESQ